MKVSARAAAAPDVPDLLELYRELETEMVELKRVWALTEGLPAPANDALAAAVTDPARTVLMGEIDEVPLGFLIGEVEELLPQADGEKAAAVRFIFTTPAAREVGVGEAMVERFLSEARSSGIRLFDAHVSPGHRAAKNFFESHGFKARHIVMHSAR